MITLEQYLNAVDYTVTSGEKYLWNCFGTRARFLDSEDGNFRYSINIVFDTKTRVIYGAEAHDYNKKLSFRLINPDYLAAFAAECIERNIDYDLAYDEEAFIDLETDEDMLEKIRAIFLNEEYDTRIVIPLDLDDDLILSAALLAHKKDMKLNDYIQECILSEIEKRNHRISVSQQL